MLDHENDQAASTGADAPATDTPPSAPPRRRRRSASRPAGPPVVTEPTSETPATPEPVPEPEATPEPEPTPEPEAEPTPEPASDPEIVDPDDEEDAVAETDEPGEVKGEPIADPVFDAPAKKTSARARRATRVATDPFAVPEIDVSSLRPPREREQDRGWQSMPTEPTTTPDGDEQSTVEGSATAGEDEGGATRRRRRRSGSRSGRGAGSEPSADEPAADDQKQDEQKPDDQKPDEQKSDERKPAAKRSRSRKSRTEASDEQTSDDQDTATTAEDTAGATDSESPEPTPATDDTQTSGAAPSDDDSDDSDDDSQGRRRRRRRGGRRRRRGGESEDADSDDSDDSSESGSDDQAPKAKESGDSDDDSDDDSDESGRRRRRRRRRRSGEDVDETARRRANDAVTGIDGSTRLEAKRQRRREGRDAGRRRTPILSEAEFLARRESVKRTMIIRQRESLSQIAVLEDDVLVEHYVDHSTARSLIGNVYLGKVQNVLPSMEAAFIDIGQNRNAVLYAGEVDWSSFDSGGNGRERRIEQVLKSGQAVLVQVTKDPIGAKGARLTNHISIPGRYIVYSPGGHLSGISRKLPDVERKRLKQILADHLDANASVIVRTAAEGASEDELVRDVTRLKAQWESIEKKIKNGGAPQNLYAEPDSTVRIVRDLFTEDFAELIIAGSGENNDAFGAVTGYVQHVAPHLADRIRQWPDDDSTADVFAAHRVDEQIAKALERKVHLPSGGSLIIDRTEAMTVIDVNTGKFTGSGGNLEATVTSNNLEAAEEIVRQIRLRDIGGIIVIDFIDMVLPNNRELLLRRLVECLGRDRTRHQVAEVTSLGLVQMTRKRIGTGLGEAFSTKCDHCGGRGYLTHTEPVEHDAGHDADGDGSGGRDRGRGRGGRNRKPAAESPKTPTHKPLPKIMPPIPEALRPKTAAEEAEQAADPVEVQPDAVADQPAADQPVDEVADALASLYEQAAVQAADDADAEDAVLSDPVTTETVTAEMADEVATEDTPANETAVDDAPVDEASVDEAPVDEAPVEAEPADVSPVEAEPAADGSDDAEPTIDRAL